jgi:hypothetical protein
MTIFNIKPSYISRRKFCIYSIVLPICSLLNPVLSSAGLTKTSNLVVNNFDVSAVRVGKWMIVNLSINKSINLLKTNQNFLERLPELSKLEIKQMIKDDFTNKRELKICGILFSVKETILCIIAANYKR